MAVECSDEVTGVGVPEAYRAIVVGRGQQITVGMSGYRIAAER